MSTLLHADRCSLFLVQGDRGAVPAPDTSKCKSASIVNTTAPHMNVHKEETEPVANDGRIQPVGCLSMDKNSSTHTEMNSTPPLNITSPSTGSVIVGSPIGSTNTGSIDLPFKSETFSTSSTHLQTPSNGSHGCHSKCLVSKLFDVCSQSTLQEMEKKKEIRIPWGTGIVGYVAESGEPVNIPDAYKVSRLQANEQWG